MPFSRPTLTALQQQAISDITTANLPISGNLLPRSVLRTMSYAMAGLAYLHYGYLDWLALQSVPWSATAPEYLEAWAALKNVIRKPAASATGSVIFTGTDSTLVPNGTLVQRADGVQFVLDGDVTISGTTATGTVTAVVPAAASDTDPSTSMTMVTVIAGITSVATSSALTGGADIETTDSLRSRMLFAFQNPPQGGSSTDYVSWALSVPGVTRAWCNPNGVGAGTVVVYFMNDLTEAEFSGFPQGTNGGASSEVRATPATGDQLVVANYIFPLRTVTAIVIAAAPIAFPIDITIANLTPSTAAIRAAIGQALTNVLVRIGSPLAMTVYESDLTTAIAAVPGVQEFVLTIPATTTAVALGYLPVCGTVTFV